MEEFSAIMYERAQALSEIPFSVWLPVSEDDIEKNRSLQPLLLVFEHIRDNSELYNLLLKSTNSSKIFERIRNISADAITKFVEAKVQTDPIPHLTEVPIDFLAAFFSGALLSVARWWLKEDMRHSPEEVSNMFRRLIFRGTTGTLGLLKN